MVAAGPPPLPDLDRVADERTTLIEMLEYYRTVLGRKIWGLTDDELATPLPSSPLTLGGLLHHLAFVEDVWFHHRFAGNDAVEPWASAPWDDDPDWEFRIAALSNHADLVAQFEASVARSRSVVASAATLDQQAVLPVRDGTRCTLRWILVHMIEEYARHCGHADLIRESLDGSTGD